MSRRAAQAAFSREWRRDPVHDFTGPEDVALAVVVADWLGGVLDEAGVAPRPEPGPLRDAVLRSLPVLYLNRVFPQRYGHLRGVFREVFAARDTGRLSASATARELRAVVVETVAPVVEHPFYRFAFPDLPDVVLSIVHQVLERLITVDGLGRTDPVEARRLAARLAHLGFADLAETLGASAPAEDPVATAPVGEEHG
ncbi:hypothetical protein V5P93_003714 [Actinokineospora auranticolor]|uniref:Uncharacterized protein n=1 Tax=Actinokineospora auranticolor TaxID=155976 RepID=A0A2S6GJE9_9PSEU|nr:hypothetical protein [Actinokineospora auranticolor]PPK65276.1 hypothetical protein CLV40_115123 [Actinokineospora auranticolor]